MAINSIGLPPQAVAQQAGQQIPQQEQALINATVEAAQNVSIQDGAKESVIAQHVKELVEGDDASNNPADAKSDSEGKAEGNLGGLLDVSA